MPRRYKYTHREQLLSTKTVAKIAKQVHEAETPKLILRNYLFCRYDPAENLFLPGATVLDNALVGWSGRVVALTDYVFKQDVKAIATMVVLDDPDTAVDEALRNAGAGVNVVAPYITSDGYRTNDRITIRAVSALIKLSAQDISEDDNIPIQPYDTVTYKYGFFTYRKIDAQGFLDVTDIPNCHSCIKWRPFGYSAQLDNEVHPAAYMGVQHATTNLDMLLNSEKVKTIARGEITIRVSGMKKISSKTVRLYKGGLDIPIKYTTLSQDGNDVLNQKLLFCIQSDIPDDHINTPFIRPYAFVCTKVWYEDK